MNDEQNELKKLLEENLEVVRDNNRLLKLIRRDAMIGFVVKVVLYAILLGVPLFFLSQFIGPLLEKLPSATSAQDLQLLRDAYGL